MQSDARRRFLAIFTRAMTASGSALVKPSQARGVGNLRVAAGSDCGPPCGRAGCGASAKRSPCRSLSQASKRPGGVPIQPSPELVDRDQYEPAATHDSKLRHHVALKAIDAHRQRFACFGLRQCQPREVSSYVAHRVLPISPKPAAWNLSRVYVLLYTGQSASLDEATENEKAPVNRGLSLVGPPGFEPGTNGL
jgi:hypothetical protein